MNPDLKSKDELLKAGWSGLQVDAALDEPDEVGPSGHWLNTSGKPYFDVGRVAVAAYRLGIATTPPSDDLWRKWSASERPTCRPELTLRFFRLANECIVGAPAEFRSLRLSHPVMGRRSGTREKEAELIQLVLYELARIAYGADLDSPRQLDQFMAARAVLASESLGARWPSEIVVRQCRRTSYVSKAVGLRAVRRCFDAMSLVHAGLVCGPDGKSRDLINLLISSPNLRFDRKGLALP